LHAAALLIGTYSTFSGSTGQDVVPSITSLFGFIYFESIIFALGTSVFILALVKERNEAAGMTAATHRSAYGHRQPSRFPGERRAGFGALPARQRAGFGDDVRPRSVQGNQ
jgi:hypothetical protein